MRKRHVFLIAVVSLFFAATASVCFAGPKIIQPEIKGGFITSADITYAVSAHSYGGSNTDWTLTKAESKSLFLYIYNAAGSISIIAPNTAGKMYIVRNSTSETVTIKKSGGTGIEIAAGKTAAVIHSGSDYVRATADASH